MTTQKKVMLIRDSDFNKYTKSNTDSWDKLEFRPITKEWLQKQANWFMLKGSKTIATQYRHWPYPSEWVRRTNLSKYQGNYESWLYRWDGDGIMRVRASLGQPESIMGIAIMERFEVMLDDDQLTAPQIAEDVLEYGDQT
jgi:hypothetical protein